MLRSLPGPAQEQLSVAKLALLGLGKEHIVIYSSFYPGNEVGSPARIDSMGNRQETIRPFKYISYVFQWGFFNF